jgi:site-specific recombinase XerD
MLPHKQDFINYLLSNNYSPRTLFNYNRDLSAFENFLNLYSISFDSLTRFNIDQYKSVLRTVEHHKLFISDKQKDEDNKAKYKGNRRLISTNSVVGLSSKSVNRMLTSIRKYLKYLIMNDFDCPLPPERVEFVKKEKKITELAEYVDIVRLIESPSEIERKPLNQKRNRAFLELLFSTGMRISEATGLNLAQIGYTDKDTEKFIINEKIFVMGKGRKQRFVYLTDRCKKYLYEYLDTRNDHLPALFIPNTGTRKHLDDENMIRVSNNYFQMRIIQYRKLLGINIKTSAHSLRHGFATFMAEKGANVVALQNLLGHESLETTTKYLHTSEKLAQDTHKEFHPLKD